MNAQAPVIKKSARILWLHSKSMSKAQQQMLAPFFQKRGINPAQVIYASMEAKFPKARKWMGKNKWRLLPEWKNPIRSQIHKYISQINPAAVVINEDITLAATVDQRSLDSCRGGTYFFDGVPAIVIDNPLKIHTVKEFSWLLQADLAKVKRYIDGTQRVDPRFTYSVCKSASELDSFYSTLDNGLFLAADLETGKDYIESFSYTCVYNDGSIRTIVVPHFNPVEKDGCYWADEATEIAVWQIHRKIADHPILKGFQNGLYDAIWLLLHRCPPVNYLLDSMRQFHSVFCEVPQSLAFITSFLCDHYRYWKDDIKGDEKEAKKGAKISTREGMEIFWRYNGLDSYYTALDIMYMARMMTLPAMAWTLENYDVEQRMEVGPCMAMTARGMPLNVDRQMVLYEKWLNQSARCLEELRIMADDQDFNPGSPQQFASFLYDVLGAAPIKLSGKQGNKSNPKSVDEKVLKFVLHQHPLYKKVIEKVWEMKKPANLISNYGELELRKGRHVFSLSMRTETGRMVSSNSPTWFGRNTQNWQDDVRSLLVTDPGWFLFDADYSQSDSYFIAFESKDGAMIRNVLDPRDTHCIHAEFFFKQPYDEVYRRYKAKDPWAIHSTKGVRQNSKRINHGANYRMRGGTLYVVMGDEAVIATAVAMGEADAAKWNMQKKKQFCQYLLDLYVKELYPTLPNWYKDSVDDCIRNGNKITVFGGRTRLFFGNVRDDDGIHREISAYVGQGGTAGNINRAMLKIYYSGLEVGGGYENWTRDIRLHLQAHDAVVGMCRVGREKSLNKLLTIMREPVTINGQTFNIPVECEVGLSWGKAGLIKYQEDNFDFNALVAHEQSLRRKYAEGRV